MSFKQIRDGENFDPPPPSCDSSPSPPSTPPRRGFTSPPLTTPRDYPPSSPPLSPPPLNFNSDGIGKNLLDLLAFMGLRHNVSKREVIRISNAEATAQFQLLNNAFSFVRENKNLLQ